MRRTGRKRKRKTLRLTREWRRFEGRSFWSEIGDEEGKGVEGDCKEDVLDQIPSLLDADEAGENSSMTCKYKIEQTSQSRWKGSKLRSFVTLNEAHIVHSRR